MKRRIALLLVFCMLTTMLPPALAEAPSRDAGNEAAACEVPAETGDLMEDEPLSLDLGDLELVQLDLEGSEQAGDQAEATSGEEGVSGALEAEESGNASASAFPKTLKLGVKQTYALNVSKITKSKNVTFKSSKASVAAVSKKGVVKAKKRGSAKISVIVNKKTVATCKVTVLAAPQKVTLPAVSIDLGVKETFQIVPKLPNKTMASFTYSSKNKKIASVSKTGLVKGVKAGESTTITVTTHNKKKVNLTVNVKKAPSKVTLPKTLAIGKGETLQLTATLPDKSASALTWSTNNKKIAKVTKDGVVKGVKAGTAKITVKTFNKKSAVCTVKVMNAPGKVTLDTTAATVTAGQTLQLKATLPNKTASALTWTSSAKDVATVDENGLVTAVAPGTAKITVKTFNKKTATCTVTVNAAEAPTDAPTEAPTEAPTQAPTEAPTQAPTEAPTQAPTAAPTEAPTEAPTQAPTAAPTAKPAIKTATAEQAEFTINPQQTVTLKAVVTCEGEPTLTYKWYKGDAVIEGATGDSYTTEAIEANTTFKCMVSDGENSKDVTFTVSVDNELTAEAKNGKTEFTVPVGTATTLEVTARCAVGKVKYQWYQGDTALEGQTRKKLTTEAIEANTSYKCVISDAYGTAPVEVAFTVVASEDTVKMDAPVINLRKGTIKTGEKLVVNIGNYQSNAYYDVQIFKGSKTLSIWYDQNGSRYTVGFNSPLTAGEYTVRVRVSADDYEGNQAEATFTVAEDETLPTPVFSLNKNEFNPSDSMEVTVTNLPEVDSGTLNYRLEVCDSEGNEVWSETYTVYCSDESTTMWIDCGNLPQGTYTYRLRLTADSEGYKDSYAETDFTVNGSEAAKKLPTPTHATIAAVHPGEDLVIKNLKLDIPEGDTTEYPYISYRVALTDPEGNTTTNDASASAGEAFDFRIWVPDDWATGESKLTITATAYGFLPSTLKNVPVAIEAYGPVELTFSYDGNTITDAFTAPYGSFELTVGKTVEDEVYLSMSIEDEGAKEVWSSDMNLGAWDTSNVFNVDPRVEPGVYTLKAKAVGYRYTEKDYVFALTVTPIGTLPAPAFQLTAPENKDQVPVNSTIYARLQNESEYAGTMNAPEFRLTLADAGGKRVKAGDLYDYYLDEENKIYYISTDGLPAGTYTLNMEASAAGYDKASGTCVEITLVKAAEALKAPAFTLNPADTGSVNKREGLTVMITNADEQPDAASVSYRYTAVRAGGSEGNEQRSYLYGDGGTYRIDTSWWENGDYTVTITATAEGYENVSAEPFEMTLVSAGTLAAPEYTLSSGSGKVRNDEDLVVTIKDPRDDYGYNVVLGRYSTNEAGERVFGIYCYAEQDEANSTKFTFRKETLKYYTGKYTLRIQAWCTGYDDGAAFVDIELAPQPVSEQVEGVLELGKTTSGKFTDSDGNVVFSFTPPRTGRYTLASEANHFDVELYDANEKLVSSEYYYGALSDTRMLTGGKTYYYKLNYSPDGGIDGEVTVDFSIRAGDVALKLGEGVQNSFDKGNAWFSFIPEETAVYTFSANIEDGWVGLMDADLNQLTSQSFYSSSKLTYSLTKGKLYFYKMQTYSSEESVTATLTKSALQAAADGDTEITAYMGDRVALKVNASNGEGKVNYEWLCDGVWIGDSNTATLTTEPINKEVTTYTCRVTDVNDWSNRLDVTFTITADDYVENDLWIEHKGAQYVTVKPDASKTLQVDAGCNDGVMTFQWYYHSRILDDDGDMTYGDWVAISGATDKKLTLTFSDAYSTEYRCVVSDTHKNTAKVEFSVSVAKAWDIEQIGSDRQTVKIGDDVTLRVKLLVDEGANPPTYYWQMYDSDKEKYVTLSSGTQAGELTTTIEDVAKSGDYRFMVEDRNGNRDSCSFWIQAIDFSQMEAVPASGGSLAVSVGSEDKWYSFAPAEGGTYRFYSTSKEGDPDPKCEVLDANLATIGKGDDDDGLHFDFEVSLTKGGQYYFMLHNYSEDSENFTVNIEKVEE